MKIWKITDYDHFFNKILKYTEEEVEIALSKESKEVYYSDYFEVKKKNGTRLIYAVDSTHMLYKLQKNLANNFLNNIMIADDVYGFVKGYGYVDYLRRHKSFYGNKNYIRLDIKDFFGSIDVDLVRKVFDHYVDKDGILAENETEQILNALIEIILYKDKVIQGAITSPVVSNIVFRQLDLRIQKYCSKLDIVYTRYADDMLFSSYNNKVHSKFFLQRIAEIIGSKGFALNYSKTVREEKEISLNGYVVGNDVRISRKKLKDISRMLFIIETLDLKKDKLYLDKLNNKLEELTGGKEYKFYNNDGLINYLAGQRAFIISVAKKTEDEKFLKRADRLIVRIEKSVLGIYEG